MNPYNFLKQIQQAPKNGGDGFLRSVKLNLNRDLLPDITALIDGTGGTANNTLENLADGTTYANDHAKIENNFADLAAKINEIIVALYGTALETSAKALVVAASDNAIGTLNFTVPLDYDESADVLQVVLLCNSAGDTNTPVIDGTVYRKRAGAALSADLNPTASSAINNSTAKAGEATLSLSGLDHLAGDALTINLTSGAHTTDAINIYGIEVRYRSTLVASDPADRD